MKINLAKYRVIIFIISYIISQILSIRAGKLFPYVTLLFFISLFFYLRPKFNKYILFGFFLSVLLCIRGFLNGNTYLNIMEDFLIFTPILLAFVFDKNFYHELEIKLYKYLASSLFFLIPLGMVIYIYMGYNVTQVGLSRFNFNDDVILEYFSPIMPLLFAPFLIFHLNSFNNVHKIVIFLALFFISFMGIITLSRSLILNLFIPIFLYFTHRLVVIKNIKFFLSLIFFSFVIGLMINYLVKKNTLFSDLIVLLENRNVSQFDSDNISSNRNSEFSDYLQQNLTFMDYLFGRGFGGEKILTPNSSYIGGISMMHIGAAHVFLKGGVFLLIYIYLPVFFIIFYFIKNYFINISYLLIWFLIINTITTTWNLSYPFLFYTLSISFLFNNVKFKY